MVHVNKKVYVTCSTGIACTNINVAATTLHSFAGIKDGRGSKEVLLQLVRKNEDACKRWLDADVLIIDEISMVNKHVLETVEYVARNIRLSTFPFGGIQVIGVGDFYQLPPVHNSSDFYSSDEYTFQSMLWPFKIPHSLELEKVQRQRDMEFVEILNNVCEGRITDEESRFAVQFLTGKNINPYDFGVDYIPDLFCTNIEVDYRNYLYLEELPGEVQYYQSKDTGSKTLLHK